MTFSNADIIAMSKGHFFGEGNAQLPSDQMLMIDEISHIDDKGGKYNKGLLKASLAIRPDHWFFACHFQGDPVMPGCLGLDALWQLLGGVGLVRFAGKRSCFGCWESSLYRTDLS